MKKKKENECSWLTCRWPHRFLPIVEEGCAEELCVLMRVVVDSSWLIDGERRADSWRRELRRSYWWLSVERECASVGCDEFFLVFGFGMRRYCYVMRANGRWRACAFDWRTRRLDGTYAVILRESGSFADVFLALRPGDFRIRRVWVLVCSAKGLRLMVGLCFRVRRFDCERMYTAFWRLRYEYGDLTT